MRSTCVYKPGVKLSNLYYNDSSTLPEAQEDRFDISWLPRSEPPTYAPDFLDGVSIIVQHFGSISGLRLVISGATPISGLIELVALKVECPQQSILLYRKLEILDDGRLLRDCDLEPEGRSTLLDLRLKLHNGIEAQSYTGTDSVAIRLITGEIRILEVDKTLTVLDLKLLLYTTKKSLPPARQRLFLGEEELSDLTCIGDLHIDTELRCRPVLRLSHETDYDYVGLPGAYLAALFSWPGHIAKNSFNMQGLPIIRGRSLACVSLICPNWLHCIDETGREGLVPINYVAILEVLDAQLYQELKETSPREVDIPVSPARPTQGLDNTVPISQGPGASWTSVWKEVFKTTKERAETQNHGRREGKSLSDRTKMHLVTIVEEENGEALQPPPLPWFPFSSQNEKVEILQHNFGRTTFALEMRSLSPQKIEDTAAVVVAVKCISSPPERISSVSVTLRLLAEDKNEITEISPTEFLGRERHTELSLKANRKLGLQAGISLEGSKIGANYERENEVEKVATRVTQMTIKGTTIGGTARWVLAEDPGVGGQDGLPTETELCMKTRFKPRKIQCNYEVVLETKGGSEIKQFPDKIVNLL